MGRARGGGDARKLRIADICRGRIPRDSAYAPHDVVDATGCGDTYSAGYLYCRAQDANYDEAGRFAAAMCTLKLEHNGPFDQDALAVREVMQTDIMPCIAEYERLCETA